MKFRISLTSLYSILSLPSSVLIFPEFSLMLASHVPRESKSKFTYNTNFQTVSRFMRTMMITASRVMHWLLGNVFGFWCMIGAIGNNAAFFEQRPARCNWITRIALNDRYLWRHNSLFFTAYSLCSFQTWWAYLSWGSRQTRGTLGTIFSCCSISAFHHYHQTVLREMKPQNSLGPRSHRHMIWIFV